MKLVQVKLASVGLVAHCLVAHGSGIGRYAASGAEMKVQTMNEILYNVLSTGVIVAAAIFTLALLIAIIWMIVKWRSPEVQDLDAPVRQYLLDDEQLVSYRGHAHDEGEGE